MSRNHQHNFLEKFFFSGFQISDRVFAFSASSRIHVSNFCYGWAKLRLVSHRQCKLLAQDFDPRMCCSIVGEPSDLARHSTIRRKSRVSSMPTPSLFRPSPSESRSSGWPTSRWSRTSIKARQPENGLHSLGFRGSSGLGGQ